METLVGRKRGREGRLRTREGVCNGKVVKGLVRVEQRGREAGG